MSAVFLLPGVVWFHAYQLIDSLIPTALSFDVPALNQDPDERHTFFGYFSINTMPTLRYGEITTVYSVARMIWTLFKRLLVSTHLQHSSPGPAANVKMVSVESISP